MADMDLKGVDQILDKLKSLKNDVRLKSGRFALRKAAGVYVKNAKRRAEALDDRSTGRSIAKNVAARWNSRLNKRTGDLAFRVGVLGGARTTKKGEPQLPKEASSATPHWRLLQYGTEKMRAQPIFVPQESTQEALDTFTNEFNKALDRAIRRIDRGGK